MSILWRVVPDPTALPGAVFSTRLLGGVLDGLEVIPPGYSKILQLPEYPSVSNGFKLQAAGYY
jgi:hypothetical protein